MKKLLTICCTVLCFAASIFAQIPINVAVSIVKAEDERRFDKVLEDLLQNPNEQIRIRAALAAGRIGDERAIPALTNLLEKDADTVQTMAAFALGEIELIKAADAILKVLQNPKTSNAIRARLVEAAGKIAAANAKDARANDLGKAILDVLETEAKKSAPDRLTALLGLTAILRVRPENGDDTAAKFLTAKDARIRSDAANTLTRIRSKKYDEPLRSMLKQDADAIARANAARALGAAEDAAAFDLLLNAVLTDQDSRVRVSAIRSLGSLKNSEAAEKLLVRGNQLLNAYDKSKFANPSEKNELLEIAATAGKLLPNTNDKQAAEFLKRFGTLEKSHSSAVVRSPEIAVAWAIIAPEYFAEMVRKREKKPDWQTSSAMFQGIAAFAAAPETDATKNVREQLKAVALLEIKNSLSQDKSEDIALSDALNAYAAFKPEDLPQILRDALKHKDAVVRTTAAGLLGETAPDEATNEAFNRAFEYSLLNDKQLDDAQLAILDAYTKLDKNAARGTLLLALHESDYLVRRKAIQLIRANDLANEDDVGLLVQTELAEKERSTVKRFNDFSRSKLGVILNTDADYNRAVSRQSARAIIKTDKGTFTIEFLPQDAPLTVDNFINLAKAKFFDGIMIHRVVPNFVMQDGDPRGDGNGGPGWQIRDEINMAAYERGAVGMALSGKDTGGSQWFATHSPQPHLDGGYTIFGRVNEIDMKVVDNLVRGDKILTVKIVEGNAAPTNTKRRRGK